MPRDSQKSKRSQSRSTSSSSDRLSRHSHMQKSRCCRWSRSRSAQRLRVSSNAVDASKMQDMINSLLSSALALLQQQLAKISSASNDSSSQLRDLRKQQKLLEIESKSHSLSSAGAHSQFCCMAGLALKLNGAIESSKEILLSCSSPEDPMYQSIAAIRDQRKLAVDNANERIDLIFKANANPKIGWKAISMYKEKQRQPNSDPKKHKLWLSCLKLVQDQQKKASRPAATPFYPQPGWKPGRGLYSGGGTKSSYSWYQSYAFSSCKRYLSDQILNFCHVMTNNLGLLWDVFKKFFPNTNHFYFHCRLQSSRIFQALGLLWIAHTHLHFISVFSSYVEKLSRKMIFLVEIDNFL